MFFYKTVKNQAQKTILTAPLDWGLGHATRCIPIIRELNELGHNVIIAAEGSIKSLLQKEFPANLFIPLGGYRITYTKSGFWLPFNLFLQFPKIAVAVIKEHIWLKKMVKQYQIDAVISDNRFGLYHRNVLSIYITHQLFIKTGNNFSESAAQKIHGWFIKKYDECWVPDLPAGEAGFENGDGIAGKLSHPEKKLNNIRYIGCLSRFEKQEGLKKEYQLLILISGPEPQRTIFENKLLEQVKNTDGKILFVRGLPGTAGKAALSVKSDNIVLKDHLTSDELCSAMQQSEMVICRSGYTSVMDLIKLKQKAILVPTPGQSEQEYIAANLHEQQIFFAVSQDKFQLQESLKSASKFKFNIPDTDMDIYKKVISDFTQRL
jgi:uncharacterized protein (TIGR00661 family)